MFVTAPAARADINDTPELVSPQTFHIPERTTQLNAFVYHRFVAFDQDNDQVCVGRVRPVLMPRTSAARRVPAGVFLHHERQHQQRRAGVRGGRRHG